MLVTDKKLFTRAKIEYISVRRPLRILEKIEYAKRKYVSSRLADNAEDDDYEILRQVGCIISTCRKRLPSSVWFGSLLLPTGSVEWVRTQPFVGMKSAKRRRTIVAGVVTRTGRRRPTLSLPGIGFHHKSVERCEPVPDERTLPDNIVNTLRW